MNILIFSQIFFNFVISITVIVLGLLIGVIALEVIQFIKSVKKFSEGVRAESEHLYQRLNSMLGRILSLSFVSKFFKKEKRSKKKVKS